MKYGRLKNGEIIELESDIKMFGFHTVKANLVCYVDSKGNVINIEKEKENILVKESDFLPELFDEELLFENGVYFFIRVDYANNTYWWKYGDGSEKPIPIKPTDDIRGAIWTEKGLTFVAKMKDILPNEEIDWELL